jgi:GTP-binding protein
METGDRHGLLARHARDPRRLFIGPGDLVYEGMIVGENPRADDLPVNPTKAKQLTNHRSTGEWQRHPALPPLKFSLERAIEYIAARRTRRGHPEIDPPPQTHPLTQRAQGSECEV